MDFAVNAISLMDGGATLPKRIAEPTNIVFKPRILSFCPPRCEVVALNYDSKQQKKTKDYNVKFEVLIGKMLVNKIVILSVNL